MARGGGEVVERATARGSVPPRSAGERLADILELLKLAEKRGVAHACRLTGYSRDSYYRFRRRWLEGGVAALVSMDRRRPLLKNRVSRELEETVVALTLEHPEWSRERMCEELTSRDVRISPSGVRGVWRRCGLLRQHLREEAARAAADS